MKQQARCPTECQTARVFPRGSSRAPAALAAAACLGAAGWLGCVPDVWAETAAADTPLEEVIVHARRRAERIQDIPVSVTAVSGEELRRESAELLQDVGRDVPNVRMVSSPQSVSALDVTMRGQTVNRSAIMFDPAVGLYVDGVYIANGQGSMATLLDIDSVEVVRGSQGTLFGRNNTGGSISLNSRRPDFAGMAAELAVGGGEYGAFMDRAIVNVPLSSTLAVRLAFQGDQHRGFGSSFSTGQDNLENQHRYQARFGALWRPGETSELYFTYERFEAREGGAVLHPLSGPQPGTLVSQIGAVLGLFPIPGLPAVAFPGDPYQTDGSYPAFDNARTDLLHLTFSQRLATDLTMKLILGYRHLDAQTALDVDASPLPLADTTLYNTSNQKSAELQFNGKSGPLDWVAGLYAFRDNGGAPSVQAPASPQFLDALVAVAQASSGAVNLLPYFSPWPVYDHNSATNTSSAAYLHGEYHLTSAWAVAAGVRYTQDRRAVDDDSFVDIPGVGHGCTLLDLTQPPTYQIAGPCPAIHRSVGYGFWSWEFSTRYRLSPGWNTYARIGRSQRSGGWNIPLATLQDQPYRPEQLTDYELGLKGNLFGGALAVSGDVFYGNYDDMQRLLARLNPDGTPVTTVTNAGRARVGGAELEAMWHFTRQAALQAVFGWTDARYRQFLYTPVPGAPTQDLSGNSFYQTPRLQGDVAASYQFPTAAGDVLLRADYAWQSAVQFNVINDFNFQGAYGTANARVALASPVQSWELALYATNLTDRRYAYTGGTLGAPLSPSPTIAWQIPGARRLVGVEGTWRWNSGR
ncbi:MAG: TonB-dependent receptor [Proteobacteria bacterium]|nr:TonB-dependent receptor [Pseudomonadota bacterium]